MKVEIIIYFRAHHLWFLKGTVSLEKDGVLSYVLRFSKWRPHCIYINQTYLLLHASHSGMRHWASAYSEGAILKDRSSFVGGSQTCKITVVRGQLINLINFV